MISLNLLPPEEKSLLVSQAAMRKILIQSISFIFLIFVFFGLLSSVWLYLKIQLKSAEEILYETETGQRGKAYHALREKTGEANEKLQKLSDIQRKNKGYFPAFEALAEIVPQGGISLNRLSLNQGNLSLDGHSDSRSILLLFKSSLEKSPFFEKIENPVSNLLKQNDIDFTVKMQIK